MDNQLQTALSFSDKWNKNDTLAFDVTLDERSEICRWILSRNGFDDIVGFNRWLSGRARILDAGCGNGRVTALLRKFSEAHASIVGIDLTSAHVAEKNLAGAENVVFRTADLLGDLSTIGKFDLIYCQEVLHHTSDPKKAFFNLVDLLCEFGEIAIYVYKKKAPMREHCDDYVRHRVASLDYDSAMQAMRQLTELGRVLSSLNIKVDIPEVKILGISAGTYDIQRFLYNYFTKCFWNSEMSFESNAVVNYDWYHPSICSRHTVEEIEGWFHDAELTITHTKVDEYGITMRGIKSHEST